MSDAMVQEQWLTAQQTVLGSVMIDAACADAVLARTGVSDYTGVYRDIFLIIQELVQAGIEPDPVAVLAKMNSSKGSPRQVVAELIDLTPTSANCQLYIEILVEQAKLDKVRQLGAELVNCMTLPDADRWAAAVAEVLATRSDQPVYGMRELLERFYARHTSRQPVRYLKWGLDKLDLRLYAEPGDFIILGGYPSDGKTALALSFAWHQSADMRVGFFSLETREDKMFDRQVAMVTGISMGRIKRNQLDDDDWTRVADSAQGICKRMLDIVPAAGRSATEILNFAKARGYQVIYIDYIQLLRAENPRAPRYEQVSQTSMTLHTLANQYGISVVGLSQLSRPDKARAKPAPKMSDLRESGQLEQDADVILLLYRLYPDDGARTERDLKIAKNKEGQALKLIALDFDGSTQRFSLRKDTGKPLRERGAEAREEMTFQAQQMDLLNGPAAECPFR